MSGGLTHRCCYFVILVVVGILKGYDPLVNLVLDETKEFIRGKRDY